MNTARDMRAKRKESHNMGDSIKKERAAVQPVTTWIGTMGECGEDTVTKQPLLCFEAKAALKGTATDKQVKDTLKRLGTGSYVKIVGRITTGLTFTTKSVDSFGLGR